MSSDFHKRSTAKGKRKSQKSKKIPSSVCLISPAQSRNQDSIAKPPNGQDEQNVKSDKVEKYEKELEMEKFRNDYQVVAENSIRMELGNGKYSRAGGLWSSGVQFKLYDASEGEKAKPRCDIEDIVIEEVEGRPRKPSKAPGTDKSSMWPNCTFSFENE